jgi:hypothetical protein
VGLALKGLERRARAERLIAPDDHLVAVEAGDASLWVSAGKVTRFGNTNMVLAYSRRSLVVIGAEMLSAVDLLMLWKLTANEPLRQIEVTYLHDRDDCRTSFTWHMTRRNVQAFADEILAAAERRRADFPQDVQDAVTAWGREFERRVDERRRVAADFDRAPAIGLKMSLPISLQSVVFDPSDAPIESAKRTERRGQLLWLDDDTFAVRINLGVIAHFPRTAITRLGLTPESPGALEMSGQWELGYASSVGERRLYFEGPAFSLFPSQLDESADEFINAAGLVELMDTGTPWRADLRPASDDDHDEAPRQLNNSAPRSLAVTDNPPPRRVTPKRR